MNKHSRKKNIYTVVGLFCVMSLTMMGCSRDESRVIESENANMEESVPTSPTGESIDRLGNANIDMEANVVKLHEDNESDEEKEGKEEETVEEVVEETPQFQWDGTPKVLETVASGITVYGNESAEIDASNISKGYVMVKYLGNNPKVRMQIETPIGDVYTYVLSQEHIYESFPLTRGDGNYSVKVFENVSGDQYALACGETLSVQLENGFSPFLYPNQYVSFTKDSNVVKKAQELATECNTDLDVVTSIYHYVVENVTYDYELASTVTYGYLPNVDTVLATNKGICFDYAALMSSMLRSQGIPTKLEVGYAGSAYHAWISVYIDGVGWIDNIIQFDGHDWHLLDPTFASTVGTKETNDFIGDGTNYQLKYSY